MGNFLSGEVFRLVLPPGLCAGGFDSNNPTVRLLTSSSNGEGNHAR